MSRKLLKVLPVTEGLAGKVEEIKKGGLSITGKEQLFSGYKAEENQSVPPAHRWEGNTQQWEQLSV